MKSIFCILFFSLTFSLVSCNKKPSEQERRETEQYSGMRQNDLSKYQQERIAIEQEIATTEQRIKDLHAGKYQLNDEDLKIELELAQNRLNDLNIKLNDDKNVIEKIRKELDSLDVLLKK